LRASRFPGGEGGKDGIFLPGFSLRACGRAAVPAPFIPLAKLKSDEEAL